MTPGEALAERIREYVSTQVSSDLVDIVTRTVALTLNTLMANPAFTNELTIVSELQEENQWLKTQVIQLQRVLALATSQTRSGTTSKRSNTSNTSKKASVKPRPSSPPTSRTSSKSGKPSRSVGGSATRTEKANFLRSVRQARGR